MRADRLITLLLLLQSRGRMSARELAGELEVSERTIYRDVEALSAAGIPLYGEPGRDGGFALLERYRTSLTGLTEGESRALFMLRIPAPLAELGLGQELQSALLKLAAALPDSRRESEERTRQRFHLDSNWWRQGDEAVPHLQTLYQAVWEDRRVTLRYQPMVHVEIEQCQDAYGLVAKAGIWYLVSAAHGQIHVHRVSQILEAQLTEEHFDRPAGFDLAAFWRAWCAGEEQRQSLFTARVRVGADFIAWLPVFFGKRIHERIAAAIPADEQGRITLELAFESLEAARSRLLSLGRAVEVLSPLPLRSSLLDYANQVVDLYSGNPSQEQGNRLG